PGNGPRDHPRPARCAGAGGQAAAGGRVGAREGVLGGTSGPAGRGGSELARGTPSRVGPQGIRAANPSLLGRRRDRVRIGPRVGARRRLRATPSPRSQEPTPRGGALARGAVTGSRRRPPREAPPPLRQSAG